MPRVITEELQGYRFGVGQREVPVTDEQGNPVFSGGAGGVKTRSEWIIEFVEQQPAHLHLIRVPLSDEAREELIRQLTGGIAVAKAMPQGPISL
jgi:hypothetical protein